jgi:hypothetical protein
MKDWLRRQMSIHFLNWFPDIVGFWHYFRNSQFSFFFFSLLIEFLHFVVSIFKQELFFLDESDLLFFVGIPHCVSHDRYTHARHQSRFGEDQIDLVIFVDQGE